jgi:hypothetical protein
MTKILLDVYEMMMMMMMSLLLLLLSLLLLFTAVEFSLGGSSMRSEIIVRGQNMGVEEGWRVIYEIL